MGGGGGVFDLENDSQTDNPLTLATGEKFGYNGC